MHKVPPQLEVGNFTTQLVWLAISFILLYFLMARLALPRIERVLHERKSRIGGDLERAREAQHLSEKTMERYEAGIASAKAKGQGTVRAAREKLEAELNGKRGALDHQLAAKAAETEKKVQSFLDRAAGEMEAMTAGVVSDIVKEFAGVEASEDEVRTALRQTSKG
jgi:F-type H+-transporting ATPase subunit b